jgi:hypothetical protein
MDFSITNIDHGNFDLNALHAYFPLRENRCTSFEYDGISAKFTVSDDYDIQLEDVKGALEYQPEGRYLIDYHGWERRIKIVCNENKLIAWASYDLERNDCSEAFFSRPIVPLFYVPEDSERPSRMAKIEGIISGRKLKFENHSRKRLLELGKYGSWFNDERVEMEIVSDNCYDSMAFEQGVVTEKRGIKYHSDYEDTLKWLHFQN